MAEKTHVLKCIDHYFDAVVSGEKTFEVRRNDRAFQTGDMLKLVRTTPGRHYLVDEKGEIRGDAQIMKRITYLLQGGQLGIEPAFCVLGLGEPSPDTRGGRENG